MGEMGRVREKKHLRHVLPPRAFAEEFCGGGACDAIVERPVAQKLPLQHPLLRVGLQEYVAGAVVDHVQPDVPVGEVDLEEVLLGKDARESAWHRQHTHTHNPKPRSRAQCTEPLWRGPARVRSVLLRGKPERASGTHPGVTTVYSSNIVTHMEYTVTVKENFVTV